MGPSSTDMVELDLPKHTPQAVREREQSFALHPFALYTIADISENEYSRSLERCNSRYGDHENSVRRPPKYGFVGRSFQEILDYHITLAKDKRYDMVNFLVITSKEWEQFGIILVTLDDELGNVDSCQIPAEDTGITLVNLQIGNADWKEIKDGPRTQNR